MQLDDAQGGDEWLEGIRSCFDGVEMVVGNPNDFYFTGRKVDD
jgi:hypothetical protein